MPYKQYLYFVWNTNFSLVNIGFTRKNDIRAISQRFASQSIQNITIIHQYEAQRVKYLLADRFSDKVVRRKLNGANLGLTTQLEGVDKNIINKYAELYALATNHPMTWFVHYHDKHDTPIPISQLYNAYNNCDCSVRYPLISIIDMIKQLGYRVEKRNNEYYVYAVKRTEYIDIKVTKIDKTILTMREMQYCVGAQVLTIFGAPGDYIEEDIMVYFLRDNQLQKYKDLRIFRIKGKRYDADDYTELYNDHENLMEDHENGDIAVGNRILMISNGFGIKWPPACGKLLVAFAHHMRFINKHDIVDCLNMFYNPDISKLDPEELEFYNTYILKN